MFTEQQIIDIIFFMLRNVLGDVIYFIFFASILTPKYNKYLTVVLQSTVAVLAFELIGNLGADVTLPFFILLVCVNCLLFYKEKKRYCLLAAGYFFAIILTSDIFVSSATLYIFGYYLSQGADGNWNILIANFFCTILLVILLAGAILLWNRLFKKKNVKSMGMFLLFPFGQAFFIAAFAKGTYENNSFYIYSEPLFIASVIISIISDVVMYFALKDNSNMNSMRKRLKEIENEMEQQLKYYDALADKYTEIREYRHDILNLISISEIMQEKKLSETESKAYINEMKKKAEAMEVPIFCGNPLVNAVLWQKQQSAKKSGVAFSADIEPKEEFPIDRIDICSLMVNLADNALRECENCDNPFVEIEVSRKINMLFINVTNSCGMLSSKKTSKLRTTKSGDHGYGMEIINKIAKKYNGEFAFSAENGTASASVMLEISQ